MTEYTPEENQDPAEQYETDTEVETNEQAVADEPVEPEPVTVGPVTFEAEPAPGLLDKFEVTPERGHRLKH